MTTSKKFEVFNFFFFLRVNYMIVLAKMKFNPLPQKKFTLLTTTIIFLLSKKKKNLRVNTPMVPEFSQL
jgi:hypothetical protein